MRRGEHRIHTAGAASGAVNAARFPHLQMEAPLLVSQRTGQNAAHSTLGGGHMAERRKPAAARGHDPAAAPTMGNSGHSLAGETPERLLGYYADMVLIRKFELSADQMYKRAKIGGYCHLNLGEEATVVGLMAALRPSDYLFTNYRDHGYALMRGLEPGRVMAELFGKSTGVSRGRGGSMHMFDTGARLMGGYGIVGGQIPPATGAALALTYRGGPGPDAEVVMCQMGDGTTNIGAFHESLNLAAVWHLNSQNMRWKIPNRTSTGSLHRKMSWESWVRFGEWLDTETDLTAMQSLTAMPALHAKHLLGAKTVLTAKKSLTRLLSKTSKTVLTVGLGS